MALQNVGPMDDGSAAFFDMELGTGASHQMGNGNFAIADFNNDGTPDIFVTGETAMKLHTQTIPHSWLAPKISAHSTAII